MTTTVGGRIAEGRKSAGFDNQSEFARRLGVSRQAVNAWELNSSHPSAKQLSNIALLTFTNYDYIATGRGNPKPSALGIVGARVVGAVEAEAWREGKSLKDRIKEEGDEASIIVPSLPSPDLVGMHQFAVQAQGESSNLAVRAGEYAICVSYNDARPYGPQAGDLVVLEKRRGSDDKQEFKHWIARLHLVDGHWEARFESSDLRWQNEPPVRFDKDFKLDETDNLPIEIIGCVMGSFRYELGRRHQPSQTTTLINTLANKLVEPTEPDDATKTPIAVN